jgi:hypothetical protein
MERTTTPPYALMECPKTNITRPCLYSIIYCSTVSDGFRLICWSTYCKILRSLLSTTVLYRGGTLRNYNVILQWMYEDMCCCSFNMLAHTQRNCLVCSYVCMPVTMYMISRYIIKKKKIHRRRFTQTAKLCNFYLDDTYTSQTSLGLSRSVTHKTTNLLWNYWV